MRRGLESVEVEPLVEGRFHDGQHHREVVGAAARHDGVGGDGLDGRHAHARRHRPKDLLQVATAALDHALDEVGGRWDHGQAVGPALAVELLDGLDAGVPAIGRGEVGRRFPGLGHGP